MNATKTAFMPRRLALALCAALLLSACAGHQANVPAPLPVPEPKSPASDKAGQIWERYESRARSAETMKGPFRISANLRYTDAKGDNTRVSSLLWGNGKEQSPYPLRLDLLAGVGSVVAKAREDETTFIVYAPEENTVYTHDGNGRTLAAFGVPIPLSLGDLTMLLTGRSGLLFLPEDPKRKGLIPSDRKATPQGAHFIVADARLPGELDLDENGAPLTWTEINNGGWTIAMEPGDKDPLIPKKLRITHSKGYNALITVKEISRVSPPFSTAQMGLTPPPDAAHKKIEE